MLARRRIRLSQVLCLAAVGFGAAAQAQILYSEDFEADATANWTVNPHPSTDETANFFFDYSTVGIPAAPNSGGTTHGMKLQANLTSAIFGGFSVSPIGLDVNALSTSGDYTMTFDLWSSTVGPFPNGGSGSTNISTYGILTSGTVSNYPGVADGVWFANSGEGGTSSDYRVYSPDMQASHQDGDPVYAAPSGSRNAGDDYYVTAFPASTMAPASQLALFPNQSGTLAAGTIGMTWRNVRIVKQGAFVAWWVDDVLMGLVDTSAMVAGGGNILFGHSDINATRSLDANAPALIFTLIDNIEIVEGNPTVDPTGACCQPNGTCSVQTQIDCISAGGEYAGNGVTCVDAACPDLAGACCRNDGTCVDNVGELGCIAMGGVFNGLGTECALVPACPDLRPANDDCAGATAITSLPAFASGDTFVATSSGSLSCFGISDGFLGDVWYTVTGTGNTLIATTCPGAPAPSPGSQFADFDAQVRVYTGSCGAFTCVAANFDRPDLGCNQEFRVQWDSVLGETYYILVSSFATDPGGFFELGVFEDAVGACCFEDGTCADLDSGSCGVQGGTFRGFETLCSVGLCPDLRPPNDDCVNAMPVVVGGSVFQSIDASQGNDALSNCDQSNNDLWFSFTPTVSGPYTIDTLATSGFNDTILDIFVGCGGPVIFCDDDGAGAAFLSEAKDIFLDAGTDYRIRVAEWGANADSDGDVGLFVSPEPFVQGACCTGTTCSIVSSESECVGGGGVYMGDFSSCADSDLDGLDDGSRLFLRDDGSNRRELPFTLDYWGVARDAITISANGYITFADKGSDGSNNIIPGGGHPLSVIAPLWDDLDPGTGFQGSVHAAARGSGSSERYIVQWDDVPEFGAENSFTFQAVIFADNSIEFRYGDIVPEAFAGDYTVGLSDEGNAVAVSISGASVDDGDCFRFVPDGLGGYTQVACANALEDISIPVNPCDTPAPVCECEFDGAAGVDVFDLLAYLDLWFVNAGGADIDGDPGVDVFDLLFFLDCWFPASAGNPCP